MLKEVKSDPAITQKELAIAARKSERLIKCRMKEIGYLRRVTKAVASGKDS